MAKATLKKISQKIDEIIADIEALKSSDPYLVDALAFANQARTMLGKQIVTEGLQRPQPATGKAGK